MTLTQLRKFISKEHKRMVEKWSKGQDQKQRTLYRTIKLSEEVGEVCEEILSFSCQQRKQKIRKKNNQALAEELADVIIVALLLSENLELDIWQAIDKKIEKINKRWK